MTPAKTKRTAVRPRAVSSYDPVAAHCTGVLAGALDRMGARFEAMCEKLHVRQEERPELARVLELTTKALTRLAGEEDDSVTGELPPASDMFAALSTIANEPLPEAPGEPEEAQEPKAEREPEELLEEACAHAGELAVYAARLRAHLLELRKQAVLGLAGRSLDFLREHLKKWQGFKAAETDRESSTVDRRDAASAANGAAWIVAEHLELFFAGKLLTGDVAVQEANVARVEVENERGEAAKAREAQHVAEARARYLTDALANVRDEAFSYLCDGCGYECGLEGVDPQSPACPNVKCKSHGTPLRLALERTIEHMKSTATDALEGTWNT